MPIIVTYVTVLRGNAESGSVADRVAELIADIIHDQIDFQTGIDEIFRIVNEATELALMQASEVAARKTLQFWRSIVAVKTGKMRASLKVTTKITGSLQGQNLKAVTRWDAIDYYKDHRRSKAWDRLVSARFSSVFNRELRRRLEAS